MSLLIDIRDPNWMREEDLEKILAPHLEGVTVHCGPPSQPLNDVVMLVAPRLYPDCLLYTSPSPRDS